MRFVRLGFSLCLILLQSIIGIGATVPYSSATLAPSDGIGGDGGAPFRVDCGASAVLVGIAGRSGSFVDQIAGLCVKIDPVSGIWIGGVYETARAGGNGGKPFSKVCPVGTALVGIDGTTDRFSGTTVVASLKIDCTTLKLRTEYQPAAIKGIRRIGIYGDPEPWKAPGLQDLCYQPLRGTGGAQDQWVPVGLAFEGKAGLFVDHLHILCGELSHDPRGYRVEFLTDAKIAVPEGTPLQIRWRASGTAPDLTPHLQYRWELNDWTHTRSGFIGPQPTRVGNPCSYADPPCESSWLDSTSYSQVTFHSLPPARYELHLTVSPTVVPIPAQSEARFNFEIAPNQIAGMTLNPETIPTGGDTTATVSLEGPAPKRGIIIYLASSAPAIVAVPDKIVIPKGQVSATVRLRANAQVLADQITITASLKRSFSARIREQAATSPASSVLIQPRGLDDPKTPQDTGSPESSNEPAGLTDPPDKVEQDSQSHNPAAEEPVTERGIGKLALRPSGTVAQARKPVIMSPETSVSSVAPAITQPATDLANQSRQGTAEGSGPAGTVVTRPEQLSSRVLTGPGESKQAILTIKADFDIKSQGLPKRQLQLGR